MHLCLKDLGAGTGVIDHLFLKEGVLTVPLDEKQIVAVGIVRHEPAVLVHIGPASQHNVGGLLGVVFVIQVIGDERSGGIGPAPRFRQILHPPVIKVGAGVESAVFVVLIGFLYGGLGCGQNRLRYIGRSHHMIRCLAVLIGLVDQQLSIPVVEIADEIGIRLGMLRRGPRRHGHKTTDCQAAVVEIPAGVIPVVHFRPGVLQKSLDVGFVIPAVPQEEDLPGNAGGGAQLQRAVPIQVDGLGVPLGVGQQVGSTAVVQIVVIRDGVDVAAPSRPAGEIVRIGHRKAAVTQQIVEEEQPNIVDIIPAVQRRDGEKYVGLPLRHTVPSGGFGLHDRRVDVAVSGTVDPDGVRIIAIIAVNDESGPPLGAVIRMAGQGHLLRFVGRQVVQWDRHPRIFLRGGKGRGNVAVHQQMGHKPILPIPPIQQSDALVGFAAVVKILPVKPDIAALPLTAGKGDGAVVGVALGQIVGVIVRQVVKRVQIHLVGLRQRQAGVFQQKGVHSCRGQLISRADLAAVLR